MDLDTWMKKSIQVLDKKLLTWVKQSTPWKKNIETWKQKMIKEIETLGVKKQILQLKK